MQKNIKFKKSDPKKIQACNILKKKLIGKGNNVLGGVNIRYK
jgi:hypothetical protein